MISTLRRRHRTAWSIITPLLLIGTISAYWMAPGFPADSFGEPKISYPLLLRSVVSEHYVFDLRNGYNGENMLEVKQISAINPVTELVTIRYQKAGTRAVTTLRLGLMGGKKKYSFNIKNIQPPFSITVADTIKGKTLAAVDF